MRRFFLNETATTEIYTLSLHDALPILLGGAGRTVPRTHRGKRCEGEQDRKSTRLNSSHLVISYAVFCLKKKRIGIEKIPEADEAHDAAGAERVRRRRVGVIVADHVHADLQALEDRVIEFFFY